MSKPRPTRALLESLIEPVHEQLRAAGASGELLTGEEVDALRARWRELYGPASRRRDFAWRRYDWNVFASGKRPALTGEAALERFRRQRAPGGWLLFSAFEEDPIGLRVAGPLVAVASSLDWTVAPLDLAWSMTWTHEAGYGPYFAEATDPQGPTSTPMQPRK
jgi:hypothetical protein